MHEILISEDESRHVITGDDYFVIAPESCEWEANHREHLAERHMDVHQAPRRVAYMSNPGFFMSREQLAEAVRKVINEH